jgi:hypothetical protein
MKAMHAHCARSIMKDGREVQVPPSHQLISASSNYVVVLVPCDAVNAQVIFIHQSSNILSIKQQYHSCVRRLRSVLNQRCLSLS